VKLVRSVGRGFSPFSVASGDTSSHRLENDCIGERSKHAEISNPRWDPLRIILPLFKLKAQFPIKTTSDFLTGSLVAVQLVRLFLL
jgi:hypothetical protein